MAPDRTVGKRGEERSLTARGKGVLHETRPAFVPPAPASPPARTSREGRLRLRGQPHRLRGQRLRGRGEELPLRGYRSGRVYRLEREAPPRSGRSHSRRRTRLHHAEGRSADPRERTDLKRPARSAG